MLVEAFCLASGPSLTLADVELVRQWRDRLPGRFVGVANTTFRAAPWADYLYAHDPQWWRVHGAEVATAFAGNKHCALPQLVRGVTLQPLKQEGLRHYGNSGCAAVSVAIWRGAKRVYLLGYDAALTGGKTHWHGDHPKTLGNARSVLQWPAKFQKLADDAKAADVEIINCSRATALKCFPRAQLEEVVR